MSTIIVSVIPIGGKLLMVSIKVTLPEDEQDVRMKKI